HGPHLDKGWARLDPGSRIVPPAAADSRGRLADQGFVLAMERDDQARVCGGAEGRDEILLVQGRKLGDAAVAEKRLDADGPSRGAGSARFYEGADAAFTDEDVAWVRAIGDNDRAAYREVGPVAHSSVMLKSCAPSQSVSRPISRSCAFPSTTVAKWLPASCPTLLENIVAPYGNRISISEMPPG